MRLKTYLSPEDQWDQTAELFCHHLCPQYKSFWRGNSHYDRFFNNESWLFSSWSIGRIVLAHRLFLAGDLVIVTTSNGGGSRQSVWSVTSKGHTVKGLYLGYAEYHRGQRVDAGPLRFVEGAGNLTQLRPDAPPLRQFCVGLAREAWRTPGKRE